MRPGASGRVQNGETNTSLNMVSRLNWGHGRGTGERRTKEKAKRAQERGKGGWAREHRAERAGCVGMEAGGGEEPRLSLEASLGFGMVIGTTG